MLKRETDWQRSWAQSKERLASAVSALGYPAGLADVLARQLKSPRAIDRMTSYLYQVRPRTMEMIVDEMLAICSEIDSWRKKKESEAAQAGYSAWLNSDERWENFEEQE